MMGTETEKRRFVLNLNGRLVYYSGVILNETDDYYSIDETKLGIMQVFKKYIVTVRNYDTE